jgi:lysyl oxidase
VIARLSLLAVLGAAALGAPLASGRPAQSLPVKASADPAANPCLGPNAGKFRCPDLRMGRPADLYVQRTGHGRALLRATNNVKSRGKGPVMLRGRRTGRLEMSARQHIYRTDGSRLIARTGAELYFKLVPGQGHYWKMKDAAQFELWSVDAEGHRQALVRKGPKVYYCLRDLKRTSPSRRSPKGRIFPHCNQDSRKKSVTLGTSTGWSDVYPSTYHEQWIDVTGLRGCFAYVHRADPGNHIFESREDNNDSQRIVRLPFRRGPQRCG